MLKLMHDDSAQSSSCNVNLTNSGSCLVPDALNTSVADGPFVIRDPVHGYLVAAVHERQVIDHPVTQRLRRINETGLAEYVFPEARTSRFVHSLGTMHLASRFVLAALENAEENVAKDFFEEIDTIVGHNFRQREDCEQLLRQDGTLSALATRRSSFRFDSLRGKKYRDLMAVTEGGLRLAALFHDLGHLPFSHDLEYALKDLETQPKAAGSEIPASLSTITSAEAPHEEIGHRLAELVLVSLGEGIAPSVRACFDMAIAILNTSPKYHLRKKAHATPLQWLHSIVDGEIDADRADYLLRDGQALGLDFAHYDVDRLVSNLELTYDEDLGFITAINERGLAALESYCISRTRSSQVFIRHHKVAQIATALRHASVKAFNHASSQQFRDALTELGSEDFSVKGKELLLRMARFDDTWWFQVLRDLRQECSDELTNACLDLVLDRARTLKSVWKRKGELTPEQFKAINEKTDALFATGQGPIMFAEKRRRLLDQGILINAFKFKPYVKRADSQESVMRVKSKTGIQAASSASPMIANLQDAWNKEIHLYAFVRQNGGPSLLEVVNAILDE